MLKVVVAARARTEIKEALVRSSERFGPRIARAYGALIAQSLIDLAERPVLLRSEDQLFPGCKLYHLRWSLRRARRVRGIRLGGARHFLVCEERDGAIHVLCLAHDSRDMPSLVRALHDDPTA